MYKWQSLFLGYLIYPDGGIGFKKLISTFLTIKIVSELAVHHLGPQAIQMKQM